MSGVTGQVETPLPDGRRAVSVARVIEDAARGVLFLDPGVVRLDATPAEDMFTLAIRGLDPDLGVWTADQHHPPSGLVTAIEERALPLLGSAALRLEAADGRTWTVTIGTLRIPERGATTFTVQVVAPAVTATAGP